MYSPDYFKSPEALALIIPKNGESVIACLQRRISVLKKSFCGDSDLTKVINQDFNIDELTQSQIQHLRMRCIYLRRCYDNALSYMNHKTWTECIQMSIEELSEVGIEFIKHHQTIRNWNIQFR